MTDQTQRLEIATVKAEIGSGIVHRFSNDAIDDAQIPTDSGDIPNLKQIIKTVEDKASVSTSIYPTVEAGLDATEDGGMFLVASDDDGEIYVVWRKVDGVAVDTGKRTLSSQAIQDAADAALASAEASEASAIIAQDAAADAVVLRQNLGEPDGGDLVGWQRSGLASVIATASKMLSAQSVNIWEFAHLVTNKPSLFDPDTWDWAPAINAACAGQSDIFPTVGDTHVVFPAGRYAITNAEVGRRVHMYCAGAVFAPFESDSVQSHLLKFLGHNITYNVVVDMDFSLSYDTALWVRGRYCDFTNTIIWKAKCAWTIGDPAWELDPASGKLGDSEINICGGATPWCLTSIRLYGQNTIAVASAGARIYSSRNNVSDPSPTHSKPPIEA